MQFIPHDALHHFVLCDSAVIDCEITFLSNWRDEEGFAVHSNVRSHFSRRNNIQVHKMAGISSESASAMLRTWFVCICQYCLVEKCSVIGFVNCIENRALSVN